MFNPTREQVRQFFCESWRKHRERLILEGAEATAVDLIREHPEYHALLEAPQKAIEQEFFPEDGQANPFLHLSLHLAIAEQISVDQPHGIKAAYFALRQKMEVHDAEHAVMECLGETLWRSQSEGRPMDAADGEIYLECIRRRTTG